MDRIASHANQYLKQARRVRDGKEDGYFYVEGKRLCAELLTSEIEVEQILVNPQFLSNNPVLIDSFRSRAESGYCVDADLFESISSVKSPQGIVAVCRRPQYDQSTFDNFSSRDKSLLVLLNEVNNPGNLGAVVRASEAFGADGVFISNGSANPFYSASVRGSMGSIFRMPVRTSVDFENAIEWAGNNGYHTVCADIDASQSLDAFEWPQKTLIVLGSEAHGLSVKQRRFIDSEFRIAMNPKTESLNLATAAAIILYEARR